LQATTISDESEHNNDHSGSEEKERRMVGSLDGRRFSEVTPSFAVRVARAPSDRVPRPKQGIDLSAATIQTRGVVEDVIAFGDV
jgi:hypothetical protein